MHKVALYQVSSAGPPCACSLKFAALFSAPHAVMFQCMRLFFLLLTEAGITVKLISPPLQPPPHPYRQNPNMWSFCRNCEAVFPLADALDWINRKQKKRKTVLKWFKKKGNWSKWATGLDELVRDSSIKQMAKWQSNQGYISCGIIFLKKFCRTFLPDIYLTHLLNIKIKSTSKLQQFFQSCQSSVRQYDKKKQQQLWITWRVTSPIGVVIYLF